MHYALAGCISTEVQTKTETLGSEAYLRLYDGNRQAAAGIGIQALLAGAQGQALPLKGLHYLAREPLEADGGYLIGIDDRQHPYTGGPLLAVLELPFVKPIADGVALSPNICLLLDLLHPQWMVDSKSARYQWNHCIQAGDWLHAKPCAQMGCHDDR